MTFALKGKREVHFLMLRFLSFRAWSRKKRFFHLSGRLKKKVLSWEKHIFSSMCRDEWNKKKLWKRNKVIHVLSRVKNVFCWKWSIRKKRKISLAPQGFCRRQPVVETSLTAWEDTLSWSRCSSVCHFFSVIYTLHTKLLFVPEALQGISFSPAQFLSSPGCRQSRALTDPADTLLDRAHRLRYKLHLCLPCYQAWKKRYGGIWWPLVNPSLPPPDFNLSDVQSGKINENTCVAVPEGEPEL